MKSEYQPDVATLGGLESRQTRPYGSPPYHVPLWSDNRAREFAEELLASADVPVELVQFALHVIRITPIPRVLNDAARQVLPGPEPHRPVVADVASRKVSAEQESPEIRDTLREIYPTSVRADDALEETPRAVIAAFLSLDQDGRRQVLQTLNRIEELSDDS